MRILHLVDSLNPGGMENGVVNVASRLVPQHQIAVACLKARGSFADRLPRESGIFVLGKKGGFSFQALGELRRLLREWCPDVLHAHNLGPLLYGALASNFGRRTALLQGEHASLRPDELGRKRVFQRRLFYRSCTLVHTVAPELSRQLEDSGFTHRRSIRAVLNGVDCDRFCPPVNQHEVRHRLALPKSAVLLGIVGRLVPVKRHLLLIEALERLSGGFAHVHLVVAGEGEMRGKIEERIAGSPLSSRIHLLGHQPDPVAVYQALDLLVIPSHLEGLPNVLLEAMACGVPALANVGACGVRDVISPGNDGIIAAMPDAASLASSLISALSDPAKLQVMGAAARQKMAESFTLKAMATGYERLYEECLALFRKR